MLRRLFNFMSLASLLLSVATCVLWARSYYVADVVSFETRPSPPAGIEWYVRSIRGILYFARNDHATSEGEAYPLEWSSHPPSPAFGGPVVQMGRYHFVLGPFSYGSAGSSAHWHTGATVPIWFITILTAVAPFVSAAGLVRGHRSRLRSQSGRCPGCGYDLRASPERCPECGQPSVGKYRGQETGS